MTLVVQTIGRKKGLPARIVNQIIKEKCTPWPADGDCPVLHSRVHRVCVCVKQSCCTDTEVTNYQPVAPLFYNIILSWANPTSLWRRNVEYYYLLRYTTGHAAPFGHNKTRNRNCHARWKNVYIIYRIRNTYIVMDVRYYRTVFDAILLHGFGRFGRAQNALDRILLSSWPSSVLRTPSVIGSRTILKSLWRLGHLYTRKSFYILLHSLRHFNSL